MSEKAISLGIEPTEKETFSFSREEDGVKKTVKGEHVENGWVVTIEKQLFPSFIDSTILGIANFQGPLLRLTCFVKSFLSKGYRPTRREHPPSALTPFSLFPLLLQVNN